MSRDEAKLLLLEKDEQTDETLTPNEAVQKSHKYKSEKNEFIICIYEYWKLKRSKCVRIFT